MLSLVVSLALLLIPDTNAGLLMAPISLVELTTETTMHSQESMHRIMQNMTVSHAFRILSSSKQMPEELVALVQKLEHHTTNRQQMSTELRGTVATAPTTGYSGLSGAKKMLSGMMLESMDKLDLEEVTCSEYQKTTLFIMETTRQDISTYNAASAAARGRILAASTQIEMISKKLLEFNSELVTHNAKCKIDIMNLRSQLAIVLSDIEVMSKVLELTSCKAAAASTGTLMQLGIISCKDARRHHGRSGTSFITFGHSVVRRALQGLKSQAAKKELQWGLAQIFSESTPQKVLPAWHPAVLLQQLAPGEVTNTTDAPDNAKLKKKCSVANNPQCARMRDKFLEIQTGIQDKADDMKDELAKMIMECANVKENLEAQISDFETRLKDQQTELAMATKEQNEADEQSRLKGIQLVTVQVAYTKKMRECKKNIENFESEVCGAKKIRGEVDKMAGQNLFLQDCSVSDWTPEECSASCDGGMQKLTRSLVLPPIGDAMTCPPLEMERKCNEQACPIDCRLHGWSGWSSCSTKCGGGVMQRTRTVMTSPRNGGAACGATSEENMCNIQACDTDCDLAEWTTWSPCSAACDGGSQVRLRHVSVRAVGAGECPAKFSPQRTQFMMCNLQSCKPEFTGGLTTLACEAKFDVVILLDGSGSLQQEGFDAVKAAGSMLAKAFQGNTTAGATNGAQVASLLFSGPTSWKNFRKCTKAANKGEEVPNMDTVCGLKWVDHFNHDTDKVATDIEALDWPHSTTFTSGALAMANAELTSGRPDAKTVVIVITDGRPMSIGKTMKQAKALRAKVDRLMWVPVTRHAPINRIKKWASRPAHDNVIVIDDFKTLKEPSTVTSIVASACPNVK